METSKLTRMMHASELLLGLSDGERYEVIEYVRWKRLKVDEPYSLEPTNGASTNGHTETEETPRARGRRGGKIATRNLLPLEVVAKELGLKLGTVRGMASTGKLPVTKRRNRIYMSPAKLAEVKAARTAKA